MKYYYYFFQKLSDQKVKKLTVFPGGKIGIFKGNLMEELLDFVVSVLDLFYF